MAGVGHGDIVLSYAGHVDRVYSIEGRYKKATLHILIDIGLYTCVDAISEIYRHKVFTIYDNQY